MINPGEAVKQAGVHGSIKLFQMLGATLGGLGAYILADGYRDRLPEPFDVADHLGNVGASIEVGGIGAIAGILGAAACERIETTPKNLRRGAIAVGALAGLAVNVAVETKAGLNLVHVFKGSQTGTADIAYGGLTGLATALYMASGIDSNTHPVIPEPSPYQQYAELSGWS